MCLFLLSDNASDSGHDGHKKKKAKKTEEEKEKKKRKKEKKKKKEKEKEDKGRCRRVKEVILYTNNNKSIKTRLLLSFAYSMTLIIKSIALNMRMEL